MVRLLQYVAISILAVMAALAGDARAEERQLDFNRDIRPILSDKCFHCHGPDAHTREADLRFDMADSAARVVQSQEGQPSELVARITADDPDMRMPPVEAGKPLEPEEVALLEQWVEQGAAWSEPWAYVPPERHPIPDPESAAAEHWIDRMVIARLEEQGLASAPPADKVTLVRRLYFDLIGLPPTPEQVEAFVRDVSPDGYEKLVDELLDSPHYGERMAIYWLDLVRFADTVGYHGDQDHNISPYRDWVINALNDNMPFDEFTRKQLAGDLLPNSTAVDRIASGYNRLLQTTHEGGLQPKEYEAIYAADRVRNVSAVWMGATMGCAQCHDHKYDPYTMKDFYALAAFFADIDDQQHFKDGTNELPTRRHPEMLVLAEGDRQQLEKLSGQLARAKDQLELANDLPDEQKKQLEKTIKQLHGDVKEVEARGRWTMITKALDEPRITRLLARGNWQDESGPVVQPAIPEFLGSLDTEGRRATRLDLAHWLTDTEQGVGKLTARVLANRLWYLFMGTGVCRSLDDFGGQGEPPAYPELLDNLTLELVDHDWDVKHLVREIVTSQTYRQSSIVSPELQQLDPYNQLFARQSRFRLPAEMIRDNALAISGLLNTATIGGASVKPYQPAGYYRHLNFPTREYEQHDDSRQWRRGLYVHWQRQFLHPTLKAFDAPSREECTAQRPQSNTPAAALALLNDPTFVEAARVFAARVIDELPDAEFDERVALGFRLAVSREPEPAEVAILQDLHEASRHELSQEPAAAERLVATGLAPVATGVEVEELAAWTSVARAILNMSETTTRN